MHGNVLLSIRTSALMSMWNKTHIWLLDSAASSHLCRNHDLFVSIQSVLPILIETANGKSFTASKKGTVHISLQSNISNMLPNLPITLLDMIYIPNLRANLLSVGKMTNMNMEFTFRRDHSLYLWITCVSSRLKDKQPIRTHWYHQQWDKMRNLKPCNRDPRCNTLAPLISSYQLFHIGTHGRM